MGHIVLWGICNGIQEFGGGGEWDQYDDDGRQERGDGRNQFLTLPESCSNLVPIGDGLRFGGLSVLHL